jgi:Dienelactone hydrolase family
MAFITAARYEVDAAVAYHGGDTEKYLGEVGGLEAPLLMHLAEEDEFISKAAQAEIKAALAGKANATVYSYAGQHHGVYILREFCLEKKTNVFMVPERMLQQNEDWRSLLNRLMDYRLIHNAASAMTHKSHPGNFQAFAVDIGCYASRPTKIANKMLARRMITKCLRSLSISPLRVSAGAASISSSRAASAVPRPRWRRAAGRHPYGSTAESVPWSAHYGRRTAISFDACCYSLVAICIASRSSAASPKSTFPTAPKRQDALCPSDG